MLKTNSKQARANIQKYIIENFDGTNYGIETPDTFADVAAVILDTFHNEKFYAHSNMSEAQQFADWAAGLPSILDTCYYYNRSAVDDLGEILEETESEKARYSENKAEKLLTSLIFRELKRA